MNFFVVECVYSETEISLKNKSLILELFVFFRIRVPFILQFTQ